MTEVTMSYRSSWMTEELEIFRDQFRKYLAKDLAPHAEKWREQKMVDRFAWRGLGEMGALLASVPEEYGGLGATFAYDAAVLDDLESTVPELTTGVSVHSAIVAHYILNYGSEEQKKRWLPKMASGEMVGAIAMTEPGTGSDLQAVKTTARKQGNSYVINGQKTFITNGQAADLVIVVARTGDVGAKGISLIVVETSGADGYKRGRNLDKIGLHASDTSELFFDNVAVPPDNLLGGEEGQGFVQLMQQLPQERLALAVGAVAAMERAIKTHRRLHQGAQGLRQAADGFPEHRLQARRAQDRSDDRARLRRLVHRAAGRKGPRHRHGVDGEILVLGEAGRDRRRMPAAVRRLRLYAGISDLAHLHRFPHPEDLWRDERDHEAVDREVVVIKPA
ncbi:alkylation response protein AidB-like acyl-CoA dehydrogenase [Bradyrhizobium sp. GM22.5]